MKDEDAGPCQPAVFVLLSFSGRIKIIKQTSSKESFMQYTRLGNTGLIVSRLSFGAMTFGSDPSMPTIYKVDQENARAMVEKALEAGINFFDTADGCAGGQSEAMLGEL